MIHGAKLSTNSWVTKNRVVSLMNGNAPYPHRTVTLNVEELDSGAMTQILQTKASSSVKWRVRVFTSHDCLRSELACVRDPYHCVPKTVSHQWGSHESMQVPLSFTMVIGELLVNKPHKAAVTTTTVFHYLRFYRSLNIFPWQPQSIRNTEQVPPQTHFLKWENKLRLTHLPMTPSW